jgi:hypothetical protein
MVGKPLTSVTSFDAQSRTQEFEQYDKWSFCLKAGKNGPANQERQ